jgi:hypothetical protein
VKISGEVSLRRYGPQNAAASIVEWLAHHVRRNYQQQLIVDTVIGVHAQHGLQAGQGAE